MRSAVRKTAGMILLILLLAPGFVQARPLSGSWDLTGKISAETFFSKVWYLLAFWRADSGPAAASKTGGVLDPAGQPPPPSAAGACDNGGVLDPAGNPCHG
ncbi:MAG TPA: hypothetical protein VIC28_07255 [Thermoanaerobaculia bacterium]|jgi:hypothetical protein